MGWRRSLEGMEPWRRNTLKVITVLGAGGLLLAPPIDYIPVTGVDPSVRATAWLTCLVLGVVAFFLWSTRPNF